MEVATCRKLLLMAVVLLQVIQACRGAAATSWTCPESCVCTPKGTVYCDDRNIVKSTIPSDKLYVDSQFDASIYGRNLLDKSKHLSHNQLRTVFKDVLQRMPTAKIIDLSENKLHCDCSVLWLQKWLIDNQMNKQFPNDAEYICASPPYLKGQRVKDINVTDLDCPVEGRARQRRKAGRRRKQRTYTSRPLDLCAVNHCVNGTCVVRDGASFCMCPLRYNGDTCQTRSEPQLQIYTKQLLDKTVQVNWTLDRQPLNVQFKLEIKTADGVRLIQSLMLPSEMRQMTIEGPFLAIRVRVCIYIYENNVVTNILSCQKIDIDERGHGLPPPSDLPDDKIYNPYDASDFNEVIDKASIALGSIIGLCGLLILGLAIAYKNRQIDSDNNANMPVNMNGLSSAYPTTIIQLQTIRESYEEEGQEATLADASQVPIVETTDESLNMNNNAGSTRCEGTRVGGGREVNTTTGPEPTLKQSDARETGAISLISEQVVNRPMAMQD